MWIRTGILHVLVEIHHFSILPPIWRPPVSIYHILSFSRWWVYYYHLGAIRRCPPDHPAGGQEGPRGEDLLPLSCHHFILHHRYEFHICLYSKMHRLTELFRWPLSCLHLTFQLESLAKVAVVKADDLLQLPAPCTSFELRNE